MKQKIYIISLFALSLVLFSGCTGWLSTKPESEIILEDYWQSESDVQAVVASCYRALTTSSVIYRMMIWGELRSDNMTFGSIASSDAIGKILNGEINSYNTYASWSAFYTVINYCNTVLYYAPSVVDVDENYTQADLLKTQAEVRALRALCYFYLVRAFKEVPLIEDASVSDTQDYDKPKATEDTLIAHIETDLLFAQKYAPTDYGQTDYNKGYVTQNMVNSLLADVYLWNEDYQKCADACDLVLADNSLSLVAGDKVLSRVFYVGNSTESIFELQFSDDDMINYAVNNMYGISGYTGFVTFPTALVDFSSGSSDRITGAYSPFNYTVSSSVTESEDDVRAKDSYYESSGLYFIFKYAGIQRTENTSGDDTYTLRSNTANWIVYRLSDVMLMKAEALVELGDYDNAMTLINTVYKRSNEDASDLDVANYTTQSAMEDLVLRERQREFLFEGKRWFDLLRMARRENSTSTINDYMDHKASDATSSLGVSTLNALYMPIYYSELDANPQLVQNSYYETNSSSSRN